MSKRGKAIRKVVVAVVLLAAVAAVPFLARRFSTSFASLLKKEEAKVEELTLVPRAMKFAVNATGTLRATSVQNFGGPPAFGNYWQFQIVNLVPEGKNVKKGDLLINFDAQRLMEDMMKYQNELNQATKELEKTKVQIDLESQDLQSRLAAAENNYEKLKLREGSNPEVVTARDIKLDEIALAQAKQEYETLKERIEWHKRSSEATYNIIASKKARAENKVAEIQQGMERFQAKADRDGVVVYKTKWDRQKFQVGENVWSGQPVLEIPDLNTIIAEAYIPEVDLGKIKVGQRVDVTIDALPGKTYTGTVKTIGTLVRPKAWDIPNKILEVQIALDELDISIMRPAMSIKASIQTSLIDNCLAVPLSAVRTTSVGTFVKIKAENGWQERAVKLGDSNGNDVIIAEGIKPGEIVAGDFSKVK